MIDEFSVPFRNDRPNRVGGGVVVYCKNYLISKRRNDLEPKGLECVWIEVITNKDKYLIGTFYRPPNSDNNLWNLIEHSIELANDSTCKNILITGDFNENQLNILSNTRIKHICNLFNLQQLIHEPTSFNENSSSLIDLLLTNNENMISHCSVTEPFLDINKRYHCPIIAILNQKKHISSSHRRKIWIYDRGDYEGYRNELSQINWSTVVSQSDHINDNVERFTSKILEIANKFIPHKEINVRVGELPWITKEIKNNMRKRDRMRSKAKKNQNEYYWSKFRLLRNKVVDLLRNAKNNYYVDLCNKIKMNKFSNKEWWKLVKLVLNFKQKNSQINVLLSDNETVVSDDLDNSRVWYVTKLTIVGIF